MSYTVSAEFLQRVISSLVVVDEDGDKYCWHCNKSALGRDEIEHRPDCVAGEIMVMLNG